MTIPRNLGNFADNVNPNGKVEVTGINATGTPSSTTALLGNGTWGTVTTSPAGSTGQVQINNAGAFGAVSSGTNGQVLTSQGSGLPPVFATSSSLPAPNTPSISSVTIDNPGNTIVTSSAFSVSNNAEFYSSDWQVASDTGFTTILVQSLFNTTNLTSWSVNLGSYLGQTVYVRVRYRTSAGVVSSYSSGVAIAVPVIAFYYPTVSTNSLSGTHTFTSNLSNVRVWVIGGGGAGANNYGAGGGGGGGGFINLGNVTSGQSFTYLVGSGGGKGTETNGGFSQIVWNSTTYSANGGLPGSSSSPYPGGNGGTVSGPFTASSSGGKGGTGGNASTSAQVGANSTHGGGAGGYAGGSSQDTSNWIATNGGAPIDVTVPGQGNSSQYGANGGGYFGGGGGGHGAGGAAGCVIVRANAY